MEDDMAEAGSGKLGLFDRIRHEEDAVKIVRAASLVYLAAGLFFCILSLWTGLEVWMHGLAYVVLGFLLRQFRSRIIATLLVLVVVVMVAMELRLFKGQVYSAALSIVVAAILVWVGARALEATIKLRSKAAAKATPVGDA
jgi:uncharacterized protein YacL